LTHTHQMYHALDLRAGEGVGRMSENHDKAEENTKPTKSKKPPGRRNFKKKCSSRSSKLPHYVSLAGLTPEEIILGPDFKYQISRIVF
jgi:hypothetical protein